MTSFVIWELVFSGDLAISQEKCRKELVDFVCDRTNFPNASLQCESAVPHTCRQCTKVGSPNNLVKNAHEL